ncbi:Ig-like domain-containing protein [Butyrivibrio sp. WCD3002]|uniref:Ig-like domain-containing protein n=1 Tax=Butyrivibrio sp. WCD3002 TaxID=1280676 RepID=UPI0009DC06EF
MKASVKLADKKKKLPKNAAKLRYVSSDEAIATVDKKGAVKGVNSGTCFVYVFAVNGLAKKVEIIVK